MEKQWRFRLATEHHQRARGHSGHRGTLTRPAKTQCAQGFQTSSCRPGRRWGQIQSGILPRHQGGECWPPGPRGPQEAAAGATRSPPFAQPEPGPSQRVSRDSWAQQTGFSAEAVRRGVRGETAPERGRGGTPGPAAPGAESGQVLGWEGSLRPRRPGTRRSLSPPTLTLGGPARALAVCAPGGEHT